MDELVSIMQEIRDQLIELNIKVDSLYNNDTRSLSDVIEAIEELKGDNGNSLTDVCNALSIIDSSLEAIDASIQLTI